jgi:hypothetical protein
MLFLCLLTTLAGLIAGAALAANLGYHAGGLLLPDRGWDWQVLALTGAFGLLALELAIAVFSEPTAQPEDQPYASAHRTRRPRAPFGQ